MPKTKVVLYCEEDGSVPLLDWLDSLSSRAQAKCRVRISRLQAEGHELRRPEADYLRDGIYELRVGLQGMNYRMLYFFDSTVAVVLSHGIIKERALPAAEIDAALVRRRRYLAHPNKHTHEEP